MDLRKHLSHVTGTIQRRTESWLQLVGPLLELCQNGNPSTNEVTTNSFIHLFRRESFTSAHCWCNRWCVQGLIKIRKSSWSPFEILSPSDRIRDICLSYWCTAPDLGSASPGEQREQTSGEIWLGCASGNGGVKCLIIWESKLIP